LTPFLPYLAKPAEKAAEKIAEKIGEATWERAQKLWSTLFSSPESQEANKTMEKLADKVAIVEQSDQLESEKLKSMEKLSNSLETQIEMLLESNPQLADQIRNLIEEAQNNDNNGSVFTVHSQIAKNITNARDITTLTMQ
jgi:phosphoenolpyruvate carboxylase